LSPHTDLGDDDAVSTDPRFNRHAVTSLDRYFDASELFRALAASIRLAIIDLLTAHPERFVYQIIDATGVSQALVSQHLRILRQAGIVARVQTGRQTAYRLSRPGVDEIVAAALTQPHR
jgi:DNA-binding transcriptional ArsR family regulator